MTQPNQNHSSSNSKNENSTRLNLLLKDLTEEKKRKILEIVNLLGIRPNDPLFLVTAILTDAQMSIGPLPEKLEQIQRNLTLFNARIENNLADLQEATQSLQIEERQQQKRHLPKTEIWDIAFRAAFAGTLCGALFILAFAKLINS